MDESSIRHGVSLSTPNPGLPGPSFHSGIIAGSYPSGGVVDLYNSQILRFSPASSSHSALHSA
jgi:hypothetical protein